MLRLLIIILLLANVCYAQFPPPIEITEEDASPSTYPYKIKESNNAVTDNGDGTDSVKMIVVSDAPTSSTSSCDVGQIAYDNNYVYICISDDTWKRASIITW